MSTCFCLSAQQTCTAMGICRAGRPLTSNEKGTGIGLLLVKKIADQNKHQIRVESREGSGTTFYYVIPFSPALSHTGK